MLRLTLVAACAIAVAAVPSPHHSIPATLNEETPGLETDIPGLELQLAKRFESIKSKIQKSPELAADSEVQATLERVGSKFEMAEGGADAERSLTRSMNVQAEDLNLEEGEDLNLEVCNGEFSSYADAIEGCEDKMALSENKQTSSGQKMEAKCEKEANLEEEMKKAEGPMAQAKNLIPMYPDYQKTYDQKKAAYDQKRKALEKAKASKRSCAMYTDFIKRLEEQYATFVEGRDKMAEKLAEQKASNLAKMVDTGLGYSTMEECVEVKELREAGRCGVESEECKDKASKLTVSDTKLTKKCKQSKKCKRSYLEQKRASAARKCQQATLRCKRKQRNANLDKLHSAAWKECNCEFGTPSEQRICKQQEAKAKAAEDDDTFSFTYSRTRH